MTRRFVPIAVLATAVFLPFAGLAQERDCEAQAVIVMDGVEARAEGATLEQTREALGDTLPEQAAGMLAQWIHALPEDQLTDAVGAAWQAQCESL